MAEPMTTEQFQEMCFKLSSEFLETWRQMEVNCQYAQRYEAALKEIATTLGWVVDLCAPTGPPLPDWDTIALGLVLDKLGNARPQLPEPPAQ